MSVEKQVEEYRKHAEEAGYTLNEKTAPHIAKALERCDNYCPCKGARLTGDKEKDAFLLCPCTEHHQEIKDNGKCCCNLYLKKEV